MPSSDWGRGGVGGTILQPEPFWENATDFFRPYGFSACLGLPSSVPLGEPRSAPDCSQSHFGRTLRILFRLYGFSASLGPPSFAKEALSASRFKPLLKTTSKQYSVFSFSSVICVYIYIYKKTLIQVSLCTSNRLAGGAKNRVYYGATRPGVQESGR